MDKIAMTTRKEKSKYALMGRLFRWLTNTLRCASKVHADAVNDTGDNVTGRAMKSVLCRQRMQSLRNALALTTAEASLQKGGAENKTHSLSSLVERVAQHANGNGGVFAKSVYVMLGEGALHSSEPFWPAAK